MNDPDIAESDTEAWRALAVRISAYVSTMLDPRDRLVLHVPGTDESVDIEVSVTERGRLRVVDPMTDWTGSLGDAAVVGEGVADVIAGPLCLPHPSLLTASATGPAARGIGVLALDVSADPADDVVAVPGLRNGDLLLAVLELVQAEYDPDATIDDDEDVVVCHEGRTFWIRIDLEEPTALIFAVEVPQVRSRKQALVEVNLLNRRHNWSRWALRGRSVVHSLHVPCEPFVPSLLVEMIGVFLNDHVLQAADLHERVGIVAG